MSTNITYNLFWPPHHFVLVLWRHLWVTLLKVFLLWSTVKGFSTISEINWKKIENIRVYKDFRSDVGVTFHSLKGMNEFSRYLGNVHKWHRQPYCSNIFSQYSSLTFCFHVQCLEISVVQPICHSSHVANGFVSKYLKNRLFWTKHKKKWRSFQM